MATTVVNRKVDEFDEYIGRGSQWGNPFSHKKGTQAKYEVATREEAVSKYEKWFMKQRHLICDLYKLKNKRLGCYCKPAACHGDVLAGISNAFLLVVAGSRGFDDYDLLCERLDSLTRKIEREIIIVSGTAKGADSLGEDYAQERGLRCLRLSAEWKKHGRRAGYIRNEEMARISDGVVTFWNGESPGTKHMQKLALKHGCQLKVVRY